MINGGAHAQNTLDFQEFMIAPLGAPSFREALRAGTEIFSALRSALHNAAMSTGLGDEGGFAPELGTPEAALALLVNAITAAGYEPARAGVAIALDPAASGFRTPEGSYELAGETLTSAQLVERYGEMVEQYPIWSIEDGLAEDDWDGWRMLTDRLGDHVQLVGDDLLVTNPDIIDEAIRRAVANAVLIKINQVGTVTETLDAIARSRAANTRRWSHTAPARPPTTSSRISQSRAVAAKSRAERPPAANESRSTTGSSQSSWSCTMLPTANPAPGEM